MGVTFGKMRVAAVLAGVAFATAACERAVILQGNRFPVREPLTDSQPVDGKPVPVALPDQPANRSVAIALPGMVANADWSQRGGNALHSGGHGRLSATPALIWSGILI